MPRWGGGGGKLETLAGAARKGMGAVVVVVVQREDGEIFTPNAPRDLAFAAAFCGALSAGALACAFTCRVRRDRITPYREIPVILPPSR